MQIKYPTSIFWKGRNYQNVSGFIYTEDKDLIDFLNEKQEIKIETKPTTKTKKSEEQKNDL